ncbi:MAG: right-handed parallel beta-helix repeat-containing protein [Candidatus Hodarchaeales archaeon]|jgi:parallel beta-helix repeat protein
MIPAYAGELIISENQSINFKTNNFSPIEIRGNEDFDLYNFSGSGTVDNPFIIEGYDIESTETFISVEHTDKHFHIRNNKFNGLNSLYGGIMFYNVTNGQFYDNDFFQTRIGMTNSHNITIYRNEFHDYSSAAINYGGFFGSSTFVNIVDNVITNNNFGIWVEPGVSNSLIVDNRITNNGERGISFTGSNSTILNNIISNHDIGLDIWESNNNLIVNNSINQNAYCGLRISENSFNNAILFNNFVQNQDYALKVFSDENLITNNSFINNGFKFAQAYANGSNNLVFSNYWSNWISPDNDSNGIVDNSYYLDGHEGVKDTSPLVTPPIYDNSYFEDLIRDIESFRGDNEDINRNQLWVLLILLIGIIGIASLWYFVKKKKNATYIPDIVKSTEFKYLKEIYHKLIIGIENINQNFVIEPLQLQIPDYGERKRAIDFFPFDFVQILKNELKGRTVLILIEIAYRYPDTTDQVNLYKILNIPRSTFSTDINKLIELQYIKSMINKGNFQDLRFKNYAITQKGFNFLRMLKEMLKISLNKENQLISSH